MTIFLSLYTKSFGGKISTNLHSVSPGNNFGKKINGATLEHFWVAKNFQRVPLQILTRQKKKNIPPQNETLSTVWFNPISSQMITIVAFGISTNLSCDVRFHFRGGIDLNNGMANYKTVLQQENFLDRRETTHTRKYNGNKSIQMNTTMFFCSKFLNQIQNICKTVWLAMSPFWNLVQPVLHGTRRVKASFLITRTTY